MKKTISATFESPDAAELVLTAMRRDNIPILNQSTNKVDNFEHERDIFYMAPIYSTLNSDSNNQSITPIPVVSNRVNPTREHLFHDVVSTDVTLQVEVPSNFSKKAREKLISFHGSNISEI